MVVPNHCRNTLWHTICHSLYSRSLSSWRMRRIILYCISFCNATYYKLYFKTYLNTSFEGLCNYFVMFTIILYYAMAKKHVPAFESLQIACRNAAKENWTAYESAQHFNVDRSNMCAYYRGSKPFPLGLMFEILDYVGIQVVCFKRY